MRKLYHQIELELDKITFSDIWLGFSRTEFALYNDKKVFLKDQKIPYDKRFLGNTSIDFEGDKLAIWLVEDVENEDSIILASNIVHEMFHSYQLLNGEVRFPNDLKGLDYPADLKNFEIKDKEHKLLASCFDEELTKEDKLDLLKQIVALRKLRKDRYGEDISYEFAIETIEGSAEYCGSKALKYISNSFYKERIDDYKSNLLNNTELLFDVRRMAYYTGTLFLLLLDDLRINFTQEIKGQSETIFDEVSIDIKSKIENENKIILSDLEKGYLKFIKKKENLFKNFFNNDFKRKNIDAVISGYDPMNMVKNKDLIFCSHFIMLSDNLYNENVFVEGPVVIRLEKNTLNHVIEYYEL